MDPWLAQVYGTNNGAEEDLEKIAQAEMAQQLAQQEGVDLSGLSEEQIAMLGQEVLGQNGAQGQAQPAAPGAQGAQPGAIPQPQQQMTNPQVQQQQAQPGFGPGEVVGDPNQQQGQEQFAIDPAEITEEVFAQAQQILQNPQGFAPEVVQEAQAVMQTVEQFQAQQAAQQQQVQQTPEQVKLAEAQAKFEEADFLGRVMAHAFNQETEKIAAAKLGPGNAMGHARHLVNKGMGKLKHLGGAAKAQAGKAVGHVKSHPTAYAAGAAGAGGLGAGYAAGHMSKEAMVASIEKAAMAQAANILQANGIDPATGQRIQQQPAPQPAPQIAPAGGAPSVGAQQALGDLVEKRAHQILLNLGYTFEG